MVLLTCANQTDFLKEKKRTQNIGVVQCSIALRAFEQVVISIITQPCCTRSRLEIETKLTNVCYLSLVNRLLTALPYL